MCPVPISPASGKFDFQFAGGVEPPVLNLDTMKPPFPVCDQIKRRMFSQGVEYREPLVKQIQLSLQDSPIALMLCMVHASPIPEEIIHQRLDDRRFPRDYHRPATAAVKGSPLQCGPPCQFRFLTGAPLIVAEATLEGRCSIQLSYRRKLQNTVCISGLRYPAGTLQNRLVGAEGFEPPTSCSQSRRATRLRYAPQFLPCRNQRFRQTQHQAPASLAGLLAARLLPRLPTRSPAVLPAPFGPLRLSTGQTVGPHPKAGALPDCAMPRAELLRPLVRAQPGRRRMILPERGSVNCPRCSRGGLYATISALFRGRGVSRLIRLPESPWQQN